MPDDKRTPWKWPDVYGLAWKPIGSLIASALAKAEARKLLGRDERPELPVDDPGEDETVDKPVDGDRSSQTR